MRSDSLATAILFDHPQRPVANSLSMSCRSSGPIPRLPPYHVMFPSPIGSLAPAFRQFTPQVRGHLQSSRLAGSAYDYIWQPVLIVPLFLLLSPCLLIFMFSLFISYLVSCPLYPLDFVTYF